MRLPGAVALLAATSALAQAVPLPEWVRSVTPRGDQIAVYAAPDDAAPRRGTLLRGGHFPVLARATGQGGNDCAAFVQIGDDAFVCEREVERSAKPPSSAPAPAIANSDLPYEYLQVVHEGARGYATPSDYPTDEYTTAFAAGFSLAVAARVRYRDTAFVRTRSGHYVLESALEKVRPSDFAGVELAPGALARTGWVVRDGAMIVDPETGAPIREAARLERVDIASARADGTLLLAGGQAIAAGAVRRPALHAPPPQVQPRERWIDVDLERQVLVAYAGAVPLYATLISSGRSRKATRTPRGAFRIWVKLRSSDMRDREAYELERSYSLEQVPWVQYFEQGYGLHAAFWHDRFGERQSRGCINLSPRDARYLFEFTQPALPPGWFAIRPTPDHPGTLVVVH